MKTLGFIFLIFFIVVPTVNAQITAPTADEIVQQLNLSVEEKNAFEKIFEKSYTERKKIFDAYKSSGTAESPFLGDEMTRINEQEQRDIKAVLDAETFMKYEQIMQEFTRKIIEDLKKKGALPAFVDFNNE